MTTTMTAIASDSGDGFEPFFQTDGIDRLLASLYDTCASCSSPLGSGSPVKGFCNQCGRALQAFEGPRYKKAEVSYAGAHSRVRYARGKASEYMCEHCGIQAAHWSYDGNDPVELMSDNPCSPFSLYSNEPSYYIPLCVRCHMKFDKHPWARKMV